MSALARQHNLGLSLTGKVAAVAGGTQGIGAAVAFRFATAGASVYVIGRNAELGGKVVEELKKVGDEGRTFEFIQADLSLVSGIKDVAAKLQAKSGEHGIDYLVQTQGGPPNGKFGITADGIEQHFAVQVLSRFGLAYLLAASGTIKESIVNVCAPAGTNSPPPNLDDLDLRKAGEAGGFGLIKSGKNDSAVMDGVVAEFAHSFPHLTTHHVFPGFVHTSAAANQGFPFPIPLLASIFGPLLARTPIGNFAEGYAEIPVYLAANKKSRGLGLEFSDQNLKSLGAPSWTQENPALRQQLWDSMKAMVQ